jgi:hypothetical protein
MRPSLIFCFATALTCLASVSSTSAQTSTGILMSDPRAAYPVIKDLVAKLNENVREPVLEDGAYNLSLCSEPSEFMMETKRKYEDHLLFRALVWIAIDVTDAARALSALRYPGSVWEPVVSEFERTVLAAAIQARSQGQRQLAKFDETYLDRQSAFLTRLAERLQAHQRNESSLPKVIYEPGCGAGEIQVKIVTDPRGGQVLFIPTFFYELCRVQKIDPPEDTRRCNRWREADGGRLSPVSGDYQYIAKWRDGTVRQGKLRFGADDDGKTITLSKQ